MMNTLMIALMLGIMFYNIKQVIVNLYQNRRYNVMAKNLQALENRRLEGKLLGDRSEFGNVTYRLAPLRGNKRL